MAKGVLSLLVRLEVVFESVNQSVTKLLRGYFCPNLRGIEFWIVITPVILIFSADFFSREPEPVQLSSLPLACVGEIIECEIIFS